MSEPGNYEVLLIDDGSTDGSGTICDEYERKFQQIRAFHKKMEGCRMREIMDCLRQKENMCSLLIQMIFCRKVLPRSCWILQQKKKQT